MKQLLILLVAFTITSCSNNTDLLLSRINTLENKVSYLSSERDSLLSRLNESYDVPRYPDDARTRKDSLSSRWVYGRWASLYRGSATPEGFIWDEFVYQHQLDYDERLLPAKDRLDSRNSSWNSSRWLIDVKYALDNNSFVVNPEFEIDRFNYYYSVAITNAIAKYVFDLCKKEYEEKYGELKEYDPSEYENYRLVEVRAGLAYKDMFTILERIDFNKLTKELVNYITINLNQ